MGVMLARGQLKGTNGFPCSCSRLRVWPREIVSVILSRVSLAILVSTTRLKLLLTLRPLSSIQLFATVSQIHCQTLSSPSRVTRSRKR